MNRIVSPKGPRWRGYLLTRTPVMHGGANRLGNVIPFNTEPVAVPRRGILQIPTVSGNSIRHQLREAVAHLYLNLLGPIRVPPKLYYMLFSGGANQGGDGGHFDFDERAELMRMVPPIAVFGTARDGGTYAGAVSVSSAQPVSRETWDLCSPPRPSDQWPCGAEAADKLGNRVWEQRYSSALRMLAERQYTRTDQLKNRQPAFLLGGSSAPAAELVPADDEKKGKKGRGAAKAPEASPHQMIFSAQVLVRGVALCHEMSFLQPTDELTRACFGAALAEWSSAPTIGGRAAIGHGLVDPIYDSPFPDPSPFLDFMAANREQIRAYLAKKHGAVLDSQDRGARMAQDSAQEPQEGAAGSEDGGG